MVSPFRKPAGQNPIHASLDNNPSDKWWAIAIMGVMVWLEELEGKPAESNT
jgi:hypothetical protein